MAETDVQGSPAADEVSICPDPIFVVGAPRSGTSMMQWSLRQHQRLWGGEESDFLIPLIRASHDVHQQGTRRGERHWLSSEGVEWEEFVRYVGMGMNALYTQRSDGKRWVEQTPQYTLHLDELSTMFPGAVFLFMLRDGRQVVHSLRHFVNPVEHERACQIWRTFTLAGLEFAGSDRQDRLFTVSYDEIVQRTADTLLDIYSFLGLEFAQASVEFITSRGPINSSFAGESALAKVTPRWELWTPDERRIFNEVAGDLLVELGFEDDDSWVELEVAP